MNGGADSSAGYARYSVQRRWLRPVVKQGGTTELLRPSDEAASCVLKGRNQMSYWQGVATRINIPGIALVIVGALISYAARETGAEAVQDPKSGRFSR